MISVAEAKPGDRLKWRDNAGNVADVSVINVNGSTALIRLADGSWRECPLASLTPTDITASAVRSGPVKSSLSDLAGPYGKVVDRGVIDETAMRKRASEAAPALRKGQVRLLVDASPLKKGAIGTPCDEQGHGDRILVDFGFPGPSVRALVRKSDIEGFDDATREEIRVGSYLIHKASGTRCRLLSSSEPRDLYICELQNGALEVLKSSELLTTDGQPLTKAAPGEDESLTDLCKRLSAQAK